MNISIEMSNTIILKAEKHLGKKFDYEKFNCVHFVREVYQSLAIELPLLNRFTYPPVGFHLSLDRFVAMPIGHSVFFKRKLTTSDRIWTHVAIIYSSDNLIHCTRRWGGMVVVTPRDEFMQVYSLAIQSPD